MFNSWPEINFQLDPFDAPAFGTGIFRFNLRTEGPFGFQPLNGFQFQNGDIIAQSSSQNGYASPQFTVTFSSAAFEEAMENIDLIPPMFFDGRARIDGNTTSLPPDLLFRAATRMYFGAFGGIGVPCPLDLSGNGIVDADDVFAFLALWFAGPPGAPCPGCPADWDGNGVITADDIFAFLNEWFAFGPGNPCP